MFVLKNSFHRVCRQKDEYWRQYQEFRDKAFELATVADRRGREIRSLEAKIDSLMFEHCPEEMTDEQRQRYGRAQRAAKDGEDFDPHPVCDCGH